MDIGKRTFHDKKLQVQRRTRQFRLENELIAYVAIYAQVRILLVIVDAGLDYPLVKEGSKPICFKVEFRCYVIGFVRLELQVFQGKSIKKRHIVSLNKYKFIVST
jgi:hypothetical protein